MNKYLAVFLAVFGGCAIKWQIIGFFSPAWMIYKFRASYGDFDLRMGLWTSTACFYLHNEKTCKTVLTTDIEGKLALRGDPGEYLFIYLIYEY